MRNHKKISYANTRNVFQPPEGFTVVNGEIVEKKAIIEDVLLKFMGETRDRFNKDEAKFDKIESKVLKIDEKMMNTTNSVNI